MRTSGAGRRIRPQSLRNPMRSRAAACGASSSRRGCPTTYSLSFNTRTPTDENSAFCAKGTCINLARRISLHPAARLAPRCARGSRPCKLVAGRDLSIAAREMKEYRGVACRAATERFRRVRDGGAGGRRRTGSYRSAVTAFRKRWHQKAFCRRSRFPPLSSSACDHHQTVCWCLSL